MCTQYEEYFLSTSSDIIHIVVTNILNQNKVVPMQNTFKNKQCNIESQYKINIRSPTKIVLSTVVLDIKLIGPKNTQQKKRFRNGKVL